MQQGAYRFAPSARLYADHGLCCQLIDDLPSSFGQTSIQPLIPSDGEYTADTAIGHRPSFTYRTFGQVLQFSTTARSEPTDNSAGWTVRWGILRDGKR